MRFGLCLPICRSCHIKYQNNPFFNETWHVRGQLKFEEVYSDLAFLEIFKKNYKKGKEVKMTVSLKVINIKITKKE